tara:strand:+ start:774 stop:1490 length:717 start_codon:yes stop_codon:yes gene_type:complete
VNLNLLIAFSGGFISFLSPCVLPLIPGYISYISGHTLNEIAEKRDKLVLLKTFFFSIGFSIIFIIFGLAASFIGTFFINYSNELRIFAGVVIIIFSLQLMGIINLKILNSDLRFFTKGYKNNMIFPIIVGAAFAFGWTPCIGPILGSILALASIEKNLVNSILLLSFYSLGLAIPFILSGYAVNKLISLSTKFRKHIFYISKTGGTILFVTGLLIITNKIQVFGFYLLEIFPLLSNIG